MSTTYINKASVATKWTGRQLATLRQISASASLALYRASRFTPTTGHGSLLD